MSNEQRPLKVFLCHAHIDKNTVRDLYLSLTKDGVDAWLDKEKLLPGQDWEYEIRKAVREADVVVVCLSKQFNRAGFRQKEVRLALDTAMEQPEGEIFVVPARLEECDTLESLRKWHWVDLFEEDGYEVLMRALQARADKIGATLHRKRNWLPKVTASRKPEKAISEKKSIESEQEKARQTSTGSVDVGGDVSDSVIVTGSGNVINLGKRETPESEKPIVTPKPREKKNPIGTTNRATMIALISFAGTIIAGLLSSPLIEKWFLPAPSSTASMTAPFTLTFQPVDLVMPTAQASLTIPPNAVATSTDSAAPQTNNPTNTPKVLVTATSTQTSTATSTSAPIFMQKTRAGLKFTFQIQNIPNECDLVTCELRWMVWEGSWINGDPRYGAENFSTLRYDSGWKKADDEGLTFVISIPNSLPGKPYHITFKICTDSSRSQCQTASGQYSRW